MDESSKSFSRVYEEKEIKSVVRDHVESDQFRKRHREWFSEFLNEETFRSRVYSLINEYLGSDEFRKKLFNLNEEQGVFRLGAFVKKYAGLILVTFLVGVMTTLSTQWVLKSCFPQETQPTQQKKASVVGLRKQTLADTLNDKTQNR